MHVCVYTCTYVCVQIHIYTYNLELAMLLMVAMKQGGVDCGMAHRTLSSHIKYYCSVAGEQQNRSLGSHV